MIKLIKKLSLLCFLLTFFVNINAQNKGFYVGAQLGGQSPFLSEALGRTVTQTQTQAPNPPNVPELFTTDITQHYQSLAKGYSGGIQVGYMFNELFGFELKGYYFNSPEWLLQDTLRNNLDGTQDYYRTFTEAWHLRLAPALVFNAGTGKLKPFAKVGFMFPIAGQATARRESNDLGIILPAFNTLTSFLTPNLADKSTNLDLEAVLQGKFSLGFETSVGASYAINDKMEVFGEAVFSFLKISQKKAEVTKADIVLSNGSRVDIRTLLALTGNYQYTEFADEIDYTQRQNDRNLSDIKDFTLPVYNEDGTIGGQTPNVNTLLLIAGIDPIRDYGITPDNPNVILGKNGDYSGIGFNVGIKFFFNGGVSKTVQ